MDLLVQLAGMDGGDGQEQENAQAEEQLHLGEKVFAAMDGGIEFSDPLTRFDSAMTNKYA